MKLVIIAALALVAAAAAAPAAPEAAPAPEPIKIVRSEFDKEPEGGYSFSYETENGIKQDENGEVKQVLDEENKPHDVVVIRGSYSYTDPEGNPVQVTYYADETGFHADGDVIPKAPAATR